MKQNKISITELANTFGVSPSTVSRAVNDLPGVSEELRAKIKEYARKTGYHSRLTGRGKAPETTNVVAVIIGDVRNVFYSELVFSIQRVLREHGYLLAVYYSEYNEEQEIQYIRLASSSNVAGIIQVTVASEAISQELSQVAVPIVMVNRMINTFDTDVVLLDNYEAGYIATARLIELGHSEIGFLRGQTQSSASIQRFEGYLQAMKNYHLTVEDEFVLQGDLTMKTAYEQGMYLMATVDHLPTAMVASNDISTYGLMTALQEYGVKIPTNLSLVSFDNLQMSDMRGISLSSVDPQVHYMGSTAANMMLRRIQDPTRETERVIVKPKLIERHSLLAYKDTTQFRKLR